MSLPLTPLTEKLSDSIMTTAFQATHNRNGLFLRPKINQLSPLAAFCMGLVSMFGLASFHGGLEGHTPTPVEKPFLLP